jgi:hypothetical protein
MKFEYINRNIQISNLMKIHPLIAGCSMQMAEQRDGKTDGRT